MRARSSLRVWSIAGFEPLFEGSDKEQGALRSSPATAVLDPIIIGIVEFSWVYWHHCRHRRIIGDAWQAPWLLLRSGILFSSISLNFYWFPLISFYRQHRQRSEKMFMTLIFIGFNVFLDFTMLLAREHSNSVIFRFLSQFPVQFGLGKVIYKVQILWLINVLVWRDLILLLFKFCLLCSFILIDSHALIVLICCFWLLGHKVMLIYAKGTCLVFFQIFIAFISDFSMNWYCSCTLMNCQISYVHSGQSVTPFFVFFISKCSEYHEQFNL